MKQATTLIFNLEASNYPNDSNYLYSLSNTINHTYYECFFIEINDHKEHQKTTLLSNAYSHLSFWNVCTFCFGCFQYQVKMI